ncbi:uncharacterized protein LOC105841614 [Bombyx mori]|uniref:uncharacterized protein LOC105841614 n=1 Tax=Bombyx mori TaxID=7091 RepID=UPI002ED2B47F
MNRSAQILKMVFSEDQENPVVYNKPIFSPLDTVRSLVKSDVNNISNLNSHSYVSDSQIVPYFMKNDLPGPNNVDMEPTVNYSESVSSNQIQLSDLQRPRLNKVVPESNCSSEYNDDNSKSEYSNSQNDFSSDDVDNDPDFLYKDLELSSTSEDESITMSNRREKIIEIEQEKKKGRKRRAVPKEWKKNKAKLLRNSGKAYLSSSKSKKLMKERELKPTCNDKCKLKCFNKISEEKRQIIFSNYWKMADLEKQRQFINKYVKAIKPKYRYIREGSTRKDYNHAFYFEVDKEDIRVCKTFFKNTLGISDRPIRTVIYMQNSVVGGFLAGDNRGRHGNYNKLDSTVIERIKEHINSIPRIESHYCRATTSREYIEGGLSIAQLHRDYVEKCRAETYDNAEDKQPLEDKYFSHLEEKDLVRKEKELDKKNTNNKCIAATYDLQAVMPCPRGDISNFYYISKLNVLNFTIYELGSKDVNCYVWHEVPRRKQTCQRSPCRTYKRWHHHSLHNKKPETEPAENREIAKNVRLPINCTQISRAYLKMVPVEVYKPSESTTVLALLDEGSTVTLLDSSVAKQIRLEGPAVGYAACYTCQ